ncbi:chemotaxis protein CheW [bacterium]|nr:chemotaxis protein CheW [bacterium]
MTEKKGLLFSLGHFNLCCPAENMQEVILLERAHIREIPGVRSVFRGVFVFRNAEIVPLLNLSLLMQLGHEEKETIPVGVLALKDGFHFGITISEETEIINYLDEQMQPIETSPRGLDPKFFQGVITSYGKMIFILSIENFRKYFFKEQSASHHSASSTI